MLPINILTLLGTRSAVFTVHSPLAYAVVPFALEIVETYAFDLTVTVHAPCVTTSKRGSATVPIYQSLILLYNGNVTCNYRTIRLRIIT